LAWPTKVLPEITGDPDRTLRALAREHVFVSLFRSCAESLAGENASRLSAMLRAEKNIDELLFSLSADFHRLGQDGIDAELYDVVSGFESLRQVGGD
jgi:F-type H+-transporting ATPase subunit gamma